MKKTKHGQFYKNRVSECNLYNKALPLYIYVNYIAGQTAGP